MRIMRMPFAVLILLVVAIGVQAQGFPWNDFKERKVEDVISITTKAVRPDDSMFLATNTLNTRAEVTYTGQSRPISKPTDTTAPSRSSPTTARTIACARAVDGMLPRRSLDSDSVKA